MVQNCEDCVATLLRSRTAISNLKTQTHAVNTRRKRVSQLSFIVVRLHWIALKVKVRKITGKFVDKFQKMQLSIAFIVNSIKILLIASSSWTRINLMKHFGVRCLTSSSFKSKEAKYVVLIRKSFLLFQNGLTRCQTRLRSLWIQGFQLWRWIPATGWTPCWYQRRWLWSQSHSWVRLYAVPLHHGTCGRLWATRVLLERTHLRRYSRFNEIKCNLTFFKTQRNTNI